VLYCNICFLTRILFSYIFSFSKDETELKEVKANEEQSGLQKETELKEFSPGVIKDWSHIDIKKEIGEGNFGRVYKGYLHLNEVQR
jgi:hypothetical protein